MNGAARRMGDQDIAILVPVVILWTVIFGTAIGILGTWTIGSLHPFIAIPLAFFCAIGLLRVRGVI